MTEEILVSVIIPTYKRSDMLPRAINSVLNQTYKNVEVVIVDDNNPDTEWRLKTEELMQQYSGDDRVQYVRHTVNKNGAAARNTGIRSARGTVVSFLDDDDYYYPEKIEKQLKFLLEHPEYHAVYCGWDRDGIVIPQNSGDMSFDLLSGTHLIYTNVIMMWKEDALACGGWDETFKRHQEAAFMLRYFRYGQQVGVVKDVLVKFDTSDRSNAAANAKINEEHMDHYLSSYEDMIRACDEKRKGAARDIYSFRYRGVWLNYLLTRDFKGASRLYFKMLRKYPIKFNVDIVKYLLNRRKR